MSEISNVQLPEIFPTEDIIVEGEQHRYDVYQGDNGPLPKNEYTLDKAPINPQEIGGAVLQEDSTFVDVTDRANTDDNKDVELLPSSPGLDDAFYIGRDELFTDTVIQISTGGSGTWSITWEYWDGSNWVALNNVTDGTNGFRNEGSNVVSWDSPVNWAQTDLDTVSDLYWVRARLDSFTDITQQPLAERVMRGPSSRTNSIQKVVGQVNDSEYEFQAGVDYKLSADSEQILWLNGDTPDAGSYFYVTYRTASIIGRYIESHDEQLDIVEHQLEETIDSKLIDRAEGSDLDRIGDLFGPVVGSRSGRDDESYRTYLKSVVQSFNSRGKIFDIKQAIVSALGLREVDVELVDEDPTIGQGDDGYHLQKVGIDENFPDTSYTVIIPTGVSHSVELIEDIADIADASGVDHAKTSYVIPDDVMKIADDATAVTSNTEVADTMVVEEIVLPNITLTDIQDDAVSSDTVLDRVSETITPRKTWDTNSYDTVNWEETEDSEIEQSDDEVIANIKFTEPLAEDTSISADSVLVDFFEIEWNVADWGGDGGWV